MEFKNLNMKDNTIFWKKSLLLTKAVFEQKYNKNSKYCKILFQFIKTFIFIVNGLKK